MNHPETYDIFKGERYRCPLCYSSLMPSTLLTNNPNDRTLTCFTGLEEEDHQLIMTLEPHTTNRGTLAPAGTISLSLEAFPSLIVNIYPEPVNQYAIGTFSGQRLKLETNISLPEILAKLDKFKNFT